MATLNSNKWECPQASAGGECNVMESQSLDLHQPTGRNDWFLRIWAIIAQCINTLVTKINVPNDIVRF